MLVHGSWGDHHNWDPVVPALAESFRVLAYAAIIDNESQDPILVTGQDDPEAPPIE